MIRTGVKLQLIAFLIITVVGVAYTAVRYVGVGDAIVNNTYHVAADFPDSGGIFEDAEVTYRGVPVGRVGPLSLKGDGIQVRLDLERGTLIPADTVAVVANRSAVGEQYVDLQPRRATGPYLEEGSSIPRQNTRIPVSTAELLRNTNALLASVPTEDLATVITELNAAFSDMGPDLQRLIDNGNSLVESADEVYPETVRLIYNGRDVLDTARATSGEFRSFARDLADLTDQVREDDKALRSLITRGGTAADEGADFINDVSPALSQLLGNFVTVGQVLSARVPNLRQTFVIYPMSVAAAYTVAPGDGTVHFGVELNENEPPPCKEGYDTKQRYPQDTSKKRADMFNRCEDPRQDVVPRGARNAPQPGPTPYVPPDPGDPRASSSGGNGSQAQGPSGSSEDGKSLDRSWKDVYAGLYDPTTNVAYGPDGRQYLIGSLGQNPNIMGDTSWQWLLLDPLAR
ncbi:MAG: MCE family protein [Streptosporangiales bacterium]|nr:MCE family protein [Streptosporangiales bacterium]